jgi:hypothetical protein
VLVSLHLFVDGYLLAAGWVLAHTIFPERHFELANIAYGSFGLLKVAVTSVSLLQNIFSRKLLPQRVGILVHWRMELTGNIYFAVITSSRTLS